MLLPDLPQCRALTVAETTINVGWCRRECDPFWRLYCNLDAGAEIQHRDGVIAMAPETCYLVPAWVVFKGRCRGPVRHRFIHFQVAGLPEPWLRRAAAAPATLDGLAWEAGLRETTPAARLRLHALLCRAVALALADRAPPRAAPRAEAVVAPALRLIETRLARPPSVAELAAACGVGPDHLARCFAQVVGRTPARWIQERRIAAAAERLATGEAGVAAVAAALGFANPFHFSRVFHRVTGSAPAAWRERMGAGVDADRRG